VLEIEAMKIRFPLILVFLLCLGELHADEQFFGFARGAETLPANRWELYQFITLGEGKSEGAYYGTR